MCKSRDEGGQRCYPHAAEKYNKATEALSKALARARETPSDRASARVDAARERLDEAAVQVASTDQGREMLRVERAAAANMDNHERAGYLDSVLSRGAYLQARNTAVRQAMAAVKTRNPLRRHAEVLAAESAVDGGRASMPRPVSTDADDDSDDFIIEPDEDDEAAAFTPPTSGYQRILADGRAVYVAQLTDADAQSGGWEPVSETSSVAEDDTEESGGYIQCRDGGCTEDANTGDSYDGYCPRHADKYYGDGDWDEDDD